MVSRPSTLRVAVFIFLLHTVLTDITEKCISAIAAIECQTACENSHEHEGETVHLQCQHVYVMLTKMQGPWHILTSMMTVATNRLAVPTFKMLSTNTATTSHSFAVSATMLSRAACSYWRIAVWATKKQRNLVNTRQGRPSPSRLSNHLEAMLRVWARTQRKPTSVSSKHSTS